MAREASGQQVRSMLTVRLYNEVTAGSAACLTCHDVKLHPKLNVDTCMSLAALFIALPYVSSFE